MAPYPLPVSAPAPTPAPAHVPVLPSEIIAALAPQPGRVYADATAGLGGHAALLAPHLHPGGTVILNDADPANLAAATARLREVISTRALAVTLHSVHGNFAELPARLSELNLRADLVLADLGFSSNQVDDPARGFSFRFDGPLDMRLDPRLPLSAADLVNQMPEEHLARLIADFGEDRLAHAVARKIAHARATAPITTTGALAEAVRSAYSPAARRASPIDPATRTFQALRIAVNDELGALQAFLAALSTDRSAWLAPSARVALIAFHSLEDRPVKHALSDLARFGLATVQGPLTATTAEITANPRARSAKLRVVTFTG